MILDSLAPLGAAALPDAVQNRVALLAAHAALDAQARALASLVRRLEALARAVPTGDAGSAWRGPAHTAYGASVRELGARLTEATAVVEAAQVHSTRALSTIAARVR